MKTSLIIAVVLFCLYINRIDGTFSYSIQAPLSSLRFKTLYSNRLLSKSNLDVEDPPVSSQENDDVNHAVTTSPQMEELERQMRSKRQIPDQNYTPSIENLQALNVLRIPPTREQQINKARMRLQENTQNFNRIGR